jgi:hypothetical protein
MRAAFCSYPPAGAPGLLPDTRRSSPTTISMTASRRWPPSPSPRSASTWACTCAGNRATSRRSMWPTSSARSCVICAAMSCSSGIVVRFIAGPRSRRCAKPIPGCIWKSSRRMPQNSILRSKSGTTSKATPPIVCCGTHASSAVACGPMSAGCASRKPNCAPSSLPLSCRLPRGYAIITYAKYNNTACRSRFLLATASARSRSKLVSRPCDSLIYTQQLFIPLVYTIYSTIPPLTLLPVY